MDDRINDEFIQLVNQNLGIAHKISRVYAMDAEEREDVLQEMMYQLWKSYKSFDGRSKFSTWMYSVCLNTAITHLRKEKRSPMQVSLTSIDIPDVAEDGGKEEMLTELFIAIERLDKIDKSIVLLYLEKKSHEEISEITGLTRSNVAVRFSRIKSKLSNVLIK